MARKGTIARLAARYRRRAFLAAKRLRARREGAPRLAIVSGVQRSGTNMLMDILEAAPTTDVFHEIDPRLYTRYVMGSDETVGRLIAASAFPLVVIKALHEPERVAGLMDKFAPAHFIWMFRHWDDVVNSNMRSWPGGRNRIDDIVRDPAEGAWRSSAMSGETLDELRRVYRPDFNDASAQGMFYYHRNTLFFELGLDRDPRTLVMDYDRLLAAPGPELERMAAFLQVPLTDRMRKIPSADRVRKKPKPPIDPAVAALCERVYHRLQAAARQSVLEPA